MDQKNIQNDIFLTNKELFGEEKEEAQLEYELEHSENKASSDDSKFESEEEAEEIEKEKPVKLKHRLTDSGPSFEVKAEEVSELRSNKIFITPIYEKVVITWNLI